MGILSIPGAASLTSRQWLYQLPLVVAVSAGAGLLGAGLNVLRNTLRALWPASRTPAQSLGEAMLVGAITVAVISGLSTAVGSCRLLPAHWSPDDVVQHLCPPGHYHDLATMYLGSSGVWGAVDAPWAAQLCGGAC